jgi:hypothetical protein
MLTRNVGAFHISEVDTFHSPRCENLAFQASEGLINAVQKNNLCLLQESHTHVNMPCGNNAEHF